MQEHEIAVPMIIQKTTKQKRKQKQSFKFKENLIQTIAKFNTIAAEGRQ